MECSLQQKLSTMLDKQAILRLVQQKANLEEEVISNICFQSLEKVTKWSRSKNLASSGLQP